MCFTKLISSLLWLIKKGGIFYGWMTNCIMQFIYTMRFLIPLCFIRNSERPSRLVGKVRNLYISMALEYYYGICHTPYFYPLMHIQSVQHVNQVFQNFKNFAGVFLNSFYAAGQGISRRSRQHDLWRPVAVQATGTRAAAVAAESQRLVTWLAALSGDHSFHRGGSQG